MGWSEKKEDRQENLEFGQEWDGDAIPPNVQCKGREVKRGGAGGEGEDSTSMSQRPPDSSNRESRVIFPGSMHSKE